LKLGRWQEDICCGANDHCRIVDCHDPLSYRGLPLLTLLHHKAPNSPIFRDRPPLLNSYECSFGVAHLDATTGSESSFSEADGDDGDGAMMVSSASPCNNRKHARDCDDEYAEESLVDDDSKDLMCLPAKKRFLMAARMNDW